jgi:hypothetical protein
MTFSQACGLEGILSEHRTAEHKVIVKEYQYTSSYEINIKLCVLATSQLVLDALEDPERRSRVMALMSMPTFVAF